MPSINMSLPDIEQSVARPVIFSILDQIFDITGLSKDTLINYAGKRTTIQTPGTSIDDASLDAKFSSSRITFVEVTEQYDIPAMQEIFTHAYEHVPIYHDDKLRATLRPIYTPSDVTINIRYRSNSETEVRRWMAEMLVKTARGRDINLHTVRYAYTLPEVYVTLIKDIWTLREAVEGYSESFEDYLSAHSTNRLTRLSTRAGEHSIWGVSESQAEIQGLFDFVGVPENPTRDEATGMWELSFPYKFKYQRPEELFVQYPLTVHNQFMPEKYIKASIGEEDDPRSRQTYHSYSYAALHFFELETSAEIVRPKETVVRIPSFDDFKIETVPTGTSTIFTALCFLDDDQQTLMNLKELDTYMIDPDILEFLKGESSYLGKLYQSFFNVSLYRDQSLQPNQSLMVTSDLTLKSSVKLSKRHVYHVRFALLTEISLAMQACFDRLSRYPKAFKKVVACLNELIAYDPDFNLNGVAPVAEWEMKAIFRILAGGSRGNNWAYVEPMEIINFNDVQSWKGNAGLNFSETIDDRTIANYLASKRRVLTSMSSGIVAHKR